MPKIITKGKLKKSQLIEAGVYEDYWNVTLAKYRGPKTPRMAVEKYIANIHRAKIKGLSFLFFGVNNSGKTSLAAILSKAYLLNGYSVCMTNLREMTNLFAEGWTDQEARQLFTQKIYDCDFLVIDDLNKEISNKATITVLDSVLRYRAARLRPFMITTNTDIEGLRELNGDSVLALVRRRCVAFEFKSSAKGADALVDKNLELLENLGSEN